MDGDNIYGGHSPRDFKVKFELPYKQLLDENVKFYASLGNTTTPIWSEIISHTTWMENATTRSAKGTSSSCLRQQLHGPVQLACWKTSQDL